MAAPVSQSERILILDSLRGLGILGILLMNIQGFGLPDLLIYDVSVRNETGLNYFVWYLFGPGILEGTMRAIFSMLFGAGVIIFIGRLEGKMRGLKPIEYFFRRQLWLLFFGLFDIYVLLWFGDILFYYAICGFFLFPLRNLNPKYLFAIVGLCLVLVTSKENLELYREKAIIKNGERLELVETLKPADQQTLAASREIAKRSDSTEKRRRIEKQVSDIRGSYPEIYGARTNTSAAADASGMYYSSIWDILLFMFMGMVFFKTGILQGEAGKKLYLCMAIIGLSTGLLLSYIYLQPALLYHHNYLEIIKHKQFEFYELQRLLRSLGLFGLVMYFYKSGWLKRLFALMRPVGQMAFTNYLMQSFLCGLFFYGIGFGFFGKLERYQLYYVVAVVWILEIIWSNIWLRYFNFGPMEWLWRSLTYWKKQPMRRIP